MFDAYTVKKVLPRLLIAAILIQLSWPLFTYLIYVVGQLAWGIEGLLYAPFGGSVNLELKNIISNTGSASTAAGASFLVGGAVIGAVALTTGGVLLLMISVLLSLIIAFFVLAARQVLIVVLLVTAPLALAAWIMPNTEKLWKIWWESFSKVLLMYPLIILLLAGGKITAYLVSTTGSIDVGNNGFRTALIFIAFFGPYFLIPATFKVAGSAFANLTGIANDRSRGVFDRLRKGRQEVASQAHQDRMAGKTRLGSGRTGNIYRRAARFGRDGSFNPTALGREKFGAYERKILTQSANELIEADAGFAAGQDDATSLAVQRGMTKDKFVKGMMAKKNVLTGEKYTKDEALHALAEMETSFGTKIGTGAMRVAAFKIRAGSTTAYDPNEKGKILMGQEGGALIRDGLMSTQDVAAAAKANRGRADISSTGFVDQMKFFNKGRDNQFDDASSYEAVMSAREHTRLAFEGADSREIIGGHANVAKAFAAQAEDNLRRAKNTADPAQIDKALADASNIYSSLSSTSPKKANEFADKVFSQGSGMMGMRPDPMQVRINPTTGKQEQVMVQRELTIREAIEDAKAQPNLHTAYHDRVREFTSSGEAEVGARRAADAAAEAAEEER